jgi:hypothetical protein
MSPVALPDRCDQFTIGRPLAIGMQPLLKLIQDQADLCSSWNYLAAPQCHEGFKQRYVTLQSGNRLAQAGQETAFGLHPGSFDVNRYHMAGQSRHEAGLQER